MNCVSLWEEGKGKYRSYRQMKECPHIPRFLLNILKDTFLSSNQENRLAGISCSSLELIPTNTEDQKN